MFAAFIALPIFAQTLEYEYHNDGGYSFVQEKLTVYDSLNDFWLAIKKEIELRGDYSDNWSVFAEKFNPAIVNSDLFYDAYMFRKIDAVYFPKMQKIAYGNKKVAGAFRYNDDNDLGHPRQINAVFYYLGEGSFSDIVFRETVSFFPHSDVIWNLAERTKKRLVDDDAFYSRVKAEEEKLESKLNAKIEKLRRLQR